MWGDEFDMDQTAVFETYKWNKGIRVHYYAMNIIILLNKVRT